MSDQANITVWYCDLCGYWRQDKSTGVHATANPADPNGRFLTHTLRQVEYTPLSPVVEEATT